MKPTRAFLAGLSKPNPIPVIKPVLSLQDWETKFMNLIVNAKDLGRLRMIRKWLAITINVTEDARINLLCLVEIKAEELDKSFKVLAK